MPGMARLLFLLWICSGVVCLGQTTKVETTEQFEVASVRQSKAGGPPRSNLSLANGNAFSEVGAGDVPAGTGGYFSATNQGLFRYISFAYNLNGTQYLALRFKDFAGGAGNIPGWVQSDQWDIQARANESASIGQMRRMMQALLAERFGLVVHMEKRQMAVEALVPVKAGVAGPGLRLHAEGNPYDEPASGLPPVCGVIAHLPPSVPGRNRFGGRGIPLSLLAEAMVTQTGMAVLAHPVVDETGLGGTYDFSVEWTPDIGPGGSAPEDSGPSFRQALKEQLGLKLVPGKGPVEVLVIDKVERPTAN